MLCQPRETQPSLLCKSDVAGGVTRQHSADAAQRWPAMGICVVFAQLSPRGTSPRAPRAFATLLSTVHVTSGVPVITERSRNSILFQVMRIEVSLPFCCQVTASPHQPCAGAFAASTSASSSSKAAGHSQGWGEFKQDSGS